MRIAVKANACPKGSRTRLVKKPISRDQQPMLREIRPKAPPRNFDCGLVNLSGSHFDGKHGFHFYDGQVRNQSS
jgi:hypothetical protein